MSSTYDFQSFLFAAQELDSALKNHETLQLDRLIKHILINNIERYDDPYSSDSERRNLVKYNEKILDKIRRDSVQRKLKIESYINKIKNMNESNIFEFKQIEEVKEKESKSKEYNGFLDALISDPYFNFNVKKDFANTCSDNTYIFETTLGTYISELEDVNKIAGDKTTNILDEIQKNKEKRALEIYKELFKKNK